MPAEAAVTARSNGAAQLLGALCAVALAITGVRLAALVPVDQWLSALRAPASDDAAQLVFHFSTLPRLAVAFLSGAALGLSGLILQQVLRNPLASPTTLGVSAGAQLALAVAAVWFPALLAGGRDLVAIGGGAAVAAVVLLVGWRQAFAGVPLILAGLAAGLFCGTLATVLKLAHQDYLGDLFLWGAGSLAQQDWAVAAALWPKLLGLSVLVALVLPRLALFALDDASMSGLGSAVALWRTLAVALAVLLAAIVTAAVGVIAFLELAAPQIMRRAGARTLRQQVIAAPLAGGLMLVIVDQAAQLGGAAIGELMPAGAVTALLGAPLLLWLLPRLPHAMPVQPDRMAVPAAGRSVMRTLLILAGLLGVAAASALLIGRGIDGWRIAGIGDLAAIAPWRVPRLVAAISAGAMLAAAGAVLQRLTGNAMASPELLGIGSGVALGLVGLTLWVPAPGPGLQFAAALAGVLAVVAVLAVQGRRVHFAPEPLLLTGLALTALLNGLVIAFLALGDGRGAWLLAWMSGSTARLDVATAALGAGAALVLLPACLMLLRLLDILPLGAVTAGALGVPVARARAVATLAAVLLAAAATLLVGPLSFVGLMGPHLARGLGLRRAGAHLAGAALIGGAIMAAADWLGRMLIFPYDLPAGLMAALIGMPYLVRQLGRRA